MINFNKISIFQNSMKYVSSLVSSDSISSNSKFTKDCEKFLEDRFGYKKALLTSSCTSALEMCAMIVKKYCGTKDEIIMPSYTFVSSANSFAKFGFKIKFIDIKSDMNLNEIDAISAISEKTAAILAVNYGGFSPNLELLAKVSKEAGIFFIEDNAQGIDAKYNNQYLGTFGDFSTFSFHETKNVTSGGEGGAFICNNLKYLEDAKIIREKGTNREQFFQGMVDKYTWVGLGGHYLMSELQAAFLLGQLEHLDEITKKRREIWNTYHNGLSLLTKDDIIDIQKTNDSNIQNGHLFYIKCKNQEERTKLIAHLKANDISCVFHYIPLHESPCGKTIGEFCYKDEYTTKDSARLLRLPMHYNLSENDIKLILCLIIEFYGH